jgi:hypothetical protein
LIKNYIIGFCSFLAVTTSADSYAQSISELSWIIGQWETAGESGTFSESWIQLNDSILFGHGKLKKNGDVIFSEKLRIEQTKIGLEYVAILIEKTAVFPSDSISATYVSFLDSTNDFPSRITYTKTPNGLNVLLEASATSTQVNQTLRFIRKTDSD